MGTLLFAAQLFAASEHGAAPEAHAAAPVPAPAAHTATVAAEAPAALIPPHAPKSLLDELLEGNRRFVAGHQRHPDETIALRQELSRGQKPGAVILTCADSRVPPNMLFDEGLGSLFVIRVAGNVTDDNILGSIEYAVEHLGSKLVMVLGHTNCGAVKAAVDGGELEGHVAHIVEEIAPSVKRAKRTGAKGDLLDRSVRMNVERVVQEISEAAPVLNNMTREHKVEVVGAVYHLDTGVVEMLSPQ